MIAATAEEEPMLIKKSAIETLFSSDQWRG